MGRAQLKISTIVALASILKIEQSASNSLKPHKEQQKSWKKHMALEWILLKSRISHPQRRMKIYRVQGTGFLDKI